MSSHFAYIVVEQAQVFNGMFISYVNIKKHDKFENVKVKYVFIVSFLSRNKIHLHTYIDAV